MKRISFIAACAYYYGLECAKLAAYVAGVLTLMFISHKLISWSLWVLNL